MKSSQLETERTILALAIQTWQKQESPSRVKRLITGKIMPATFETLSSGTNNNAVRFWSFVSIIEKLAKFNFTDLMIDYAKKEIQKDDLYPFAARLLKQIDSFVTLKSKLSSMDPSLLSRRVFGKPSPKIIDDYTSGKQRMSYQIIKRFLIAWACFDASVEIPQLVPLAVRAVKTTPKVVDKPVVKAKRGSSNGSSKLSSVAQISSSSDDAKASKGFGMLMTSLQADIDMFKLAGLKKPAYTVIDRRNQVILLKQILDIFDLDETSLTELKDSPSEQISDASDVLISLAGYAPSRR